MSRSYRQQQQPSPNNGGRSGSSFSNYRDKNQQQQQQGRERGWGEGDYLQNMRNAAAGWYTEEQRQKYSRDGGGRNSSSGHYSSDLPLNGGFRHTPKDVERRMMGSLAARQEKNRIEEERRRREEELRDDEDNCPDSVLRTTCDSDYYDSEEDFDNGGATLSRMVGAPQMPVNVQASSTTTAADATFQQHSHQHLQQGGSYGLRMESSPLCHRGRKRPSVTSSASMSSSRSSSEERHRKKKKKHREERNPSQMTADELLDMDSAVDPDAQRREEKRRRKEKKKAKKEEKRRKKEEKRRRREEEGQEDEDEEQEEGDEGAPTQQRVSNGFSLKELARLANKIFLPALKNSWSLLPPNQWNNVDDGWVLYDPQPVHNWDVEIAPRWLPDYTCVGGGVFTPRKPAKRYYSTEIQNDDEDFAEDDCLQIDRLHNVDSVPASQLECRFFNAIQASERDVNKIERRFRVLKLHRLDCPAAHLKKEEPSSGSAQAANPTSTTTTHQSASNNELVIVEGEDGEQYYLGVANDFACSCPEAHSTCADLKRIPIAEEPMTQPIVAVQKYYNLTNQKTTSMRLDDFEHLAKMHLYDPTCGSLKEREALLLAELFIDPKQAHKWIELARLQRPLFQLREHGDAEIRTRDMRGLFLEKEKVLTGMDRMGINPLLYNPHSVELRVELLKAEEDRHYLEESAEQRRNRCSALWLRFVNQMPKDINLPGPKVHLEKWITGNVDTWRLYIDRFQNGDYDMFNLEDTLGRMNDCLASLDHHENGAEVTEQFIADLLVHRFKLLWCCGWKARAVMLLQALAEYYFFNISDVKTDGERVELLSAFWATAFPRIGEPNALGWCNSPKGIAHREAQASLAKDAEKERHRLEKRLKRGSSLSEFWMGLETAFEQTQWAPMFATEGDGYCSPIPREWKPRERPGIFYNFKSDLGLYLPEQVILRMLHSLGAVIPGLKEERDPESILKRFSPDLFQSAGEAGYWRMGDFLINFLRLLAKSPAIYFAINVKRIHAAALLTYFKYKLHPKMREAEKRDEQEMVDAIQEGYAFIAELMQEQQSSSIILCYYYHQQMYMTNIPYFKRRAMELTLDTLRKNLGIASSFWKGDKHAQLLYLRLVQFFVARLPYVEKLSGGGGSSRAAKTVEWTKSEVLTRIILHGHLTGPALLSDDLDANKKLLNEASAKWRHILDVNYEGASDSEMPETEDDVNRSLSGRELPELAWFGNRHSILIDLASTFFHESSGHRYNTYGDCLLKSRLGKLIQTHPKGDLDAITIPASDFSIDGSTKSSALSKLLSKAVHLFPRNVDLLKRFVEVSNFTKVRMFLRAYPDETKQYGEVGDEHVRLLRACALIYLERRVASKQRTTPPSGNSQGKALLTNRYQAPPSKKEDATVKASRMNRYFNALHEAACLKSERWVEPNAYLWWLLMNQKQILLNKGGYGVTRKEIDKIFAEGRQQCPWSKQFLLEAAKHRPDNDGDGSARRDSLGLIGFEGETWLLARDFLREKVEAMERDNKIKLLYPIAELAAHV